MKYIIEEKQAINLYGIHHKLTFGESTEKLWDSFNLNFPTSNKIIIGLSTLPNNDNEISYYTCVSAQVFINNNRSNNKGKKRNNTKIDRYTIPKGTYAIFELDKNDKTTVREIMKFSQENFMIADNFVIEFYNTLEKAKILKPDFIWVPILSTKSKTKALFGLWKFITVLIKFITELILAPLIAALLAFLLGNLLQPGINGIFHTIAISQVNVRDVPRKSKNFYVNTNQGNFFSHYFENNVIFKGEKDIIVDKIKLTDVSVGRYDYSDLRIDYGLNESTQIISVFAYQNGNKNVTQKRFIVNLIKQSSDGSLKTIQHYFTDFFDFNGGDIVRILNIDLRSPKLLEKFDQNDEFLIIDVVNVEEWDKRLTDYNYKFSYDSDKTSFKNYSPGIGGPMEQHIAVENLFDLTSSRKDEYELITDQLINDENRTLKFNVLFNKAAKLTYNIEIYSQGEIVKAKSNTIRKEISIRMPIYRPIIYSHEIYNLMENKRLDYASLSHVKRLNPSLLYKATDGIYFSSE